MSLRPMEGNSSNDAAVSGVLNVEEPLRLIYNPYPTTHTMPVGQKGVPTIGPGVITSGCLSLPLLVLDPWRQGYLSTSRIPWTPGK